MSPTDVVPVAAVLSVIGLGAWLLSRGARLAGLPPLVGMLLGGAVAGAALSALDWQPAGLTASSRYVRLAILALVLARAGNAIAIPDLVRSGRLALGLAVIPLAGDAAAVTLAGVVILGLPLPSAAVLGCLVAAISPAIVIPGLLELLPRFTGRARRLLTALLVGAPIDNILALLGLGIALDLAALDHVSWGGYVQTLVFRIAGGIALGAVTGSLLALVLRRAHRLSARAGAAVVWAWAIALVAIGEATGLSFVLAIIAAGVVARAIAPEPLDPIARSLHGGWNIARYFLFGLIGAAVDTGPLLDVGLAVIAVIACGQLGRAAMATLVTTAARLSWAERSAAVMAYVPKATIQAAFAALPIDRGLSDGPLIMGAAVLAVAITAPIGAVSLHRGVARALSPESVDLAADQDRNRST